MLASEIIYEVLEDLQEKDVENPVRWSHAKMMKYLTAAMRQVVLMRPDANAVIESYELAEGKTKQSIPADATQFLGIIRNMGDDGATPGLPVTVVDRESLDAVNSAWHTEDIATSIDHYTYNEKVPEVFFVTPRPGADVYVEIECSKPPTTVAALDQELDLSDVWSEPLREYVMYRAFWQNKSSQRDMSKANEHLSRFYLLLGEETKARLVFSPNADNGGEVQK